MMQSVQLRPELIELLSSTRQAFINLRSAIAQADAAGLVISEGSARANLLTLVRSLTAHEGVTHWAISMRLFGKGDFFSRLEKGANPRTDTYEKALTKFSEAWPDDLEWPIATPRPATRNPQSEDAS